MEKLADRRVVVGLVALAAVGLLGGYGMAMRARPKATRVSLESPAPNATASGRLVYVHVGGAVRKPGLYELSAGSRVNDAVRAAGGATEDADLDALNLASKVKDGDKILVPERAPVGGLAAPGAPGASVGSTGPQGVQGSLINLNTATPADLETLPGIGPALAERIIAYRTEHGGFRAIDDLLEVPGIGPKKFEELKDQVTV